METGSPVVEAGTSRTTEANVGSPHVQVILSDAALPPILVDALERAGATVTVNRVDDVDPTAHDGQVDAVVVVAPTNQQAARPGIERVLNALSQDPCGTLILTGEPVNGLGSAVRPPELPVTFAANPSVDELAAQLATICDYGRSLRHVNEQARRMIQRGQKMVDDANHLDEQLRLAAQVQRDFLPSRTPECDAVRLVTLYRPADHVSGDIYDFARLDETHIGLSVADVTGHGVPAALLTLFVQRAWRAKEIDGDRYRIVPPDEILDRLNRDVLEADLQQCQFVTACCAVYDSAGRTITWARAGLPYPILVRAGHPARMIRTDGDLIGAFDQASFELTSEQLEPGDTLIFFTDGLEALLMGGPAGRCRQLDQTDWFARLGTVPIDDQIDEINRLLDDTPDDAWRRDDVTIVALCIDP